MAEKYQLTFDIDDYESPEELDSHSEQIDILNINIINNDFVIKVTNKNGNSHTKEAERNCKIMKFSSKFYLDEILLKISELKAEEFPDLFIFIVEFDNFEFLNQKQNSEKFQLIEEVIINFNKNRPVVLQITSKNVKVTKFYYKHEGSEKLLTIDQHNSDFKSQKNFPTCFMSFVKGEVEDFGGSMIDDLVTSRNSCLILKFIRAFKLPEIFLEDLILAIAQKGSCQQLLAALDNPFGSNGKIYGTKSYKYLSYTITFPDGVKHSVLFDAIQSKNEEISNFLVENFTYLIQELSFGHKIDISTAALETDQTDLLCDLIDHADFPFPKEFDSESIENDKLLKIADNRKKFHEAIKNRDKEAIEKFIDENRNSKFAFNTENKSALSHAFTSKLLEIFFQLKSLGFRASDHENVDYEIILEGEELKEAKTQAARQMHRNVLGAKKFDRRSVMIMMAKSTISNRMLDKETEAKYRQQMKKWFDDIYNTRSGSELIDAAAQCDQLKLIFDFECETVSNIRLQGSASASIFPNFKWIMVGAKITMMNTEHYIKGAIAHELCHYVMRQVFENNEHPYPKNAEDALNNLNKISTEINIWQIQNIGRESQNIDDECGGIISTVFTQYDEKDWHPELIVRVPQILVQFDNDPKKTAQLVEKYKPLFEFYEIYVVPQIKKLNFKNRKFNKICGLLPQIENSGLKLKSSEHMIPISQSATSIVVSNVPKLLFVNIYNQISAEAQISFIDDHNIFMKSEALNNLAILDEYMHMMRENNSMNIYVHHINAGAVNLTAFFVNQSQKLTFIVQTESQCQILVKQMNQIKQDFKKTEINFKWIDLTLESQKKLMKFDFDFQNGRTSLYRLMANEVFEGDLKQQQEEKVAIELVEVVDDQLLNFLVQNSKFAVNMILIKEYSTNINFLLLFQPRALIAVTKNKIERIKEENCSVELIEDIQTQKYIIISDIAGSGKSWTIKNMAMQFMESTPRIWVTCVDLKLFISVFKSMTTTPNFLKFMIDHVLKQFRKFETKIFTKLYEKGKVVTLFDGFDEIAPNYAETVIRIIKSFESNGGNQMLIATRDFFEVDLQKELNLNIAYKLDEFTEQDGIDLITSIWVLNEIGSESTAVVKADDIKMHRNYKWYHKRTQKLMNKLSKLQFRSIGFPLFYKMAAEVFRNGTADEHNLNLFNIYKEFVLIQIKRWSREKGEVRGHDSAVIQAENSSFMEVHQILAMKSLFPYDEEVDVLEYDDKVWSGAAIIGCGLLSKNGENFSFVHETFREFFAAVFILEQLKDGKLNFIKIFMKFVRIEKYDVIRMFINDALRDRSVHSKVVSKVHELSVGFNKNINGSENISFAFRENLENLSSLLIDLLKNSDYESVEKTVENNAIRIFRAVKEKAKTLLIFCEFFIEFLKAEYSREIVTKNEFLLELVKSTADANDIIGILCKINEKLCRICDVMSSPDVDGRNLFMFLCSNIDDMEKFKILFNALSSKSFISSFEMSELLKQCDKNGRNIIHYSVLSKNEEKLKFISEKVMESQNFKELLKQQDLMKCNILHLSVECEESKLHRTLWELLLKTFSRDELMELISQKNKFRQNLAHTILMFNNPEIVECTFEILDQVFNIDELEEMLMSKCEDGKNLLQAAAEYSKDIKIHKTLWKFLTKCSNKFLKQLICEDDFYNANYFHYAAQYSTGEIFEYSINQTAGILSREERGKLFSTLDDRMRNILQIVAECNKSQEFHIYFWKFLQDLLDSNELLKLIAHKNSFGYNFLEIAVQLNTPEIIKFYFNEIKMLLDSNDFIINDIIEVLCECNNLMKNLWTVGNNVELTKKEFLIKWNEIIEFLKLNFENSFQDLNEKFKMIEDLLECRDIESYKYKWETWIKRYKNFDELKKFLIENNFMHEIVRSCNLEIIKFTFEMLKQEKIKVSYELDMKLLPIFLILDKNKENIVQVAINSSSCETFDFLILQLSKVATKERTKKVLSNLDFFGRNLLQNAVDGYAKLDLQVSLWNVFHKYFDTSEIFKLLTHCDWSGRSLILIAIKQGPQDILELTWNKIIENVNGFDLIRIIEHRYRASKNIFHYCVAFGNEEKLKFIWEQVEEFLTSKNSQKYFKDVIKQQDSNMQNILHHAAAFHKEIKFHETLWVLLLKTFKFRDEVKKMIQQENKEGTNVVHNLVKKSNFKIVEFTIKILQNSFSDDDYKEILKSKCKNGMSLLQTAAEYSTDIEIFHTCWKILQTFFESNIKFMTFLSDLDDNKMNIFHHAVLNQSNGMLNLISEKIERISSKEEVKKLLLAVDINDQNVLHHAADRNNSIKFHKSMWKIIEKYFDRSEISEMIYHRNTLGQTVILRCVKRNKKEIVMLTWSKIQYYIKKDDHVKYLMMKDYEGNGLLDLSRNDSRKEVHEWIINLTETYNLNSAQ